MSSNQFLESIGSFVTKTNKATSKTWDAARDRKLAALWQSGATAAEVAASLSADGLFVSKNAVIGRLHRLGVNERSVHAVSEKGQSKEPSMPAKAPVALASPRLTNAPRPPRARKVQEKIAVAGKASLPPIEVLFEEYGPIVPGAPVRLMNRAPDGCCWIVTDASPWLYCPEKREPGKSYCSHHRLKMWGHGTPSERRAGKTAFLEGLK